jgi:N-acetylglucosamine-6-phosphate deacetylase
LGERPTPHFDLQVNGYGGVDFNRDGLTADDLHTACERLEADGVDGILATIITDHVDLMCGRLRTLAAWRARDPLAARLIAGLHIEGPFVNETDGYRGAHPRDAIRPAEVETMKLLLDASADLTRIVTLAPERDPHLAVTRMLTAQGIVVSAGHCDPTLDQLRAAIDSGLTMFTHVGNGCPMQMHRHDNIVQRALSLSDKLWLCFIADGAHVPFPALGNYLRLAGLDRAIIVTDSIAAAGFGPGRYTLGRREVVVDEDLVAWAPDRSHFVGSAITMAQCTHRLREALHVSESAIRTLTWDNPRRAIAGKRDTT